MSETQLNAMLAESGMEDEVFGALGAALEPLAELATEVPSPSPELLALFGEGDLDLPRATEPLAFPPGGRGSGVAAGALVLALSCVGATGLSAAANTLPTPFQQQVSEFSHRYLPFDFPQPAAHIQHAPRPSPAGRDASSGHGHGHGHVRGESEVGAAQPERTKAVSRSLEQPRATHRGMESPGRLPARTLPPEKPTDANSSAPRSSEPEPTASAPSHPTSSSSPQPDSRPESKPESKPEPKPQPKPEPKPESKPESKSAGPRPSAGVPVKLVGTGQAQGAVRPDAYGVLGGGKHHVNGAGHQLPRGPVPVAPSASPTADPLPDPVADPAPEPVVGRGPDPSTGGDQGEPSQGGAASAAVETAVEIGRSDQLDD